jgi:protein SCO1/2
MKRATLAITAIVALAFAATSLAAPKVPAKTPPPLPGDSVYQLPLSLTDQDGRTADWREQRGKPRLVSMFYTSCQYICPLIVDSGKAIDRQLTPAQQQRIGIVLISMDPARDSPAALRSVVDQRKLDTQRWTLAAPPAADVRAAAGVLGIRYRQLADGEFNHTSALVLLDADGRVLARTEQMGSRPDPAFVEAVRRAASTP